MDKKNNHRPPKERTIKTSLDKEYYSIKEVASLLGFHANTIRKLINNGELKARKVGGQYRITKEEIIDLTSPK